MDFFSLQTRCGATKPWIFHFASAGRRGASNQFRMHALYLALTMPVCLCPAPSSSDSSISLLYTICAHISIFVSTFLNFNFKFSNFSTDQRRRPLTICRPEVCGLWTSMRLCHVGKIAESESRYTKTASILPIRDQWFRFQFSIIIVFFRRW